jgi:hypothetical protein
MRKMPGGASAASCAAWPGVTCRGLGANTKPMASTWAVAAALTASALVMPQILMNMAGECSHLALCTVRAARSISGEEAAGILAPHERRADQSQTVAEPRTLRASAGVATPLSATAGTPGGNRGRELGEALRHDAQGS